MRYTPIHMNDEQWTAALNGLVGHRRCVDVEADAGMPHNSLSARLRGDTRTTTDDLLAVAFATGADVPQVLASLGIIDPPADPDGMPEYRLRYTAPTPIPGSNAARFVAEFADRTFTDRSAVDAVLLAYPYACSGTSADWKVETRRVSDWTPAK